MARGVSVSNISGVTFGFQWFANVLPVSKSLYLKAFRWSTVYPSESRFEAHLVFNGLPMAFILQNCRHRESIHSKIIVSPPTIWECFACWDSEGVLRLRPRPSATLRAPVGHAELSYSCSFSDLLGKPRNIEISQMFRL